MMSRRMIIGVLMVVSCGVFTGCGYSTGSLHRESIKTVCVEMLESREFRRDLEFQLTESLVKRIEMDTPYKIADKRYADTLFTGEILEVRQRDLGQDFKTQLPREMGAAITIRYRWKDLRTGRILVDRPQETYFTTYIPPVGETFERGMVRGLDRLAEKIVESMETPWEPPPPAKEDEQDAPGSNSAQ